jgi:hypothetical protein
MYKRDFRVLQKNYCHMVNIVGCVMAQAVSCVQSQASPREICGGQNGTRTGFSQSTLVLSCQHNSTNAPYFH